MRYLICACVAATVTAVYSQQQPISDAGTKTKGTSRTGLWEHVSTCPFISNKYSCQGPNTSKSINELGSPPNPIHVSTTAGLLPYVLFYGPSYMGQIFENILCLIPRGEFAEDIHQDWYGREPHDQVFVGDVTARLKNGARLRLIKNNEDWQAFPRILSLKEQLRKSNFTHAVFMEPHPQCFFQKEVCVPIGDGVVDDRKPTKNETAQLCFIQQQF